jgi:hypothetical protein
MRSTQARQHAPEFLDMPRIHAPPVVIFEETLQPAVTEAPDHAEI